MDWSKAINILIIAFLITNLILVYVLIDNKRDESTYLTVKEEFIREVKNLLLQKGIKIDADIPKTIPSLPLLTIEYEIQDPEKLAEKLLGDYSKEVVNGELLYKNGSKTLEIIDNKKIIYKNDSSIEIYDELNKDIAVSIAENFIKNNDFAQNDYELTDYSFDGNRHILRYTKKNKDILLEKSYMIFEIDNTGIKRFERLWFNFVKKSERKITISAAPEALLRLLTMEDVYGKTIVEISLCYYFDPIKHGAGDWKKTLKGQAGPAWRVKFSDGTLVFID
ncbi:two-component system regulatory protein YycI [Caloranaerobacter sp. DY30410]|uniref:two-component system regulatory protein YycI n=1 Tax=Caloranaerobacter sp. DY30410 TaxID=3238305 RepID=UPI003CFCC4BA